MAEIDPSQFEHLDSVFEDDLPENHRSGIVAVVGRPNVGKSTLINAILGQKIAIVTPKPQTTRTQQLAIYTIEQGQIIFVDTPGIHEPFHKVGEYMVKVAESSLKDADVILWIVDATTPPDKIDLQIAETIQRFSKDKATFLALNKIDLPSEQEIIYQYQELLTFTEVMAMSALKDMGVPELVEKILAVLPEGPRYYPIDQVTDMNMRFTASEIIREKVMQATDQEIPHAVAVEIKDYKEESKRITIRAVIYVERDSQKGILIGKKGSMIKKIGTAARHEIMNMTDKPVKMDLKVQVMKNWRSDENLLKRFGYHTGD